MAYVDHLGKHMVDKRDIYIYIYKYDYLYFK